ncbi:MAG: type III-B CRISPR-associated protein Cas10/Cmr2 [Saprospiraceae bacterium]
MNNYLFLFTIGPVQSFIAQARKTQDLYAGSRILSELIFSAYEVANANGIQLIFPKEINKDTSIPNRFLGEIKSKSDAELQGIGNKIEKAARIQFSKLANDALKESKVNFSSIEKAFWQQIEKHLEINWLFHPVEGEGDTAYRKAYTEIETLMGAVKNVRVFEQFDYDLPNENGEAGRKCSLDGERNALIFGKETNPRFSKQGVTSYDIWVNQNEGLSAVSLTKRFYNKSETDAFASTAEIAAKNIISENPGIWSVYRKCFDGKIDDAQLFYKENLTEKYLKKNGYGHVFKKCDTSTLLNCWRAVFQGNEPSSYFALVAFDGDKMGKILSGAAEYFKGSDLKEYQGKVSELLSNYAKKVEDYFKRTNSAAGAVAYTGGDDFLGFVNLEQLFEVMRWLREEFDKQVNSELKKYFQEGINFTFSAGIAVAHYKTPLSMVLDKARQMEKLAKSAKGGDRDAFAISVMKKSGESHQTYYKWDLENGMKHWKAMEELVGYFEEGYCSETFVRNLIREFTTLQDGDGNISDSGMVKLELARLVKRSLTEKGKKTKEKKEEIQRTVENLVISNTKKDGNFKLEILANAISIALFLKRNRKKQSSNQNEKNG